MFHSSCPGIHLYVIHMCHIFISLICSYESKFKWFLLKSFLPIFCLLSSFFPEIPCLLSRWRTHMQCRRCRSEFDPWFGNTPLRSKTADCSNILAWSISRIRSPGRPQSRGSESQTAWATTHRAALVLLFPWKVTVIFISICFLHFMQSKTYQTLCNILFIFLFITVPVIYCAETNDSKAQSSKTIIVSWFWGLSGLGWFSDVRAGSRSVLGLMSPQHVWALSWGCRPEYLHVACLLVRVPHSMALGSSMNVPKIAGRGWVAFYDLPPGIQR